MHVNQTTGQYYKDPLKIPMRSLAIFAAIFMGIDLFFSLSLGLKDMWRKEMTNCGKRVGDTLYIRKWMILSSITIYHW